MVRACLDCGAPNPPNARYCLVCGQELTILDALFARVTGTTADRLHQQREHATAAKAQEKTASQTRIAEMWAVEADRRKAVAEAQTEREHQDRTFLIVAVTISVFVFIAVVITLLALSRGATAFLPLPRPTSTPFLALCG